MRPWVLPAAAIILAAVELFLLLGSYILPDPLLRHQPMPFSGWIVMALLGCLGLGYGLCLLWRNDTSPGTVRRRLVFIALSLWVFTVGLTVCHPSGFSYLPSLVLNPASNSYYQTARELGALWPALRDYHEKMPDFLCHAQTQGAGPVVLFGLLSRFHAMLPTTETIAINACSVKPGLLPWRIAMKFNEWWDYEVLGADVCVGMMCGWTLVLLAALTVFPLYSLADELAGRRAAVAAVGAYSLLPSLIFFAGATDQIYPLLTALAALFVLRSLRGHITAMQRSACDAGTDDCAPRTEEQAALAARARCASLGWAAAAGGVLAVGLFLSLGMIALAGLLAIAVAIRMGLLEPPGKRLAALLSLWQPTLALLAPIVALFAFLYLAAGYDIIAVMQTSDRLRMTGYNELWGRPYWPNVWINWLEAFAGVGPLLVPAVVGMVLAYRNAARRPELWALLAALVAVLVLMDVSGKVRGETMRMWLFLAPLFALACAAAMPDEDAEAPTPEPLPPHEGPCGDDATARSSARERAYALLAIAATTAAYIFVFRFFIHVWGF